MKFFWTLLCAILFALGCGDASDSAAPENLGQVSSALVTISTDKDAYPTAGIVQITYGGLTPSTQNWVGLRPVGGTYDRWTYLPAASSGVANLQLTAAARGWYEAFVSAQNGFEKTPQFYVGPRVVTDKTTYSTESINVTFTNANLGNGLDWLAIAPVGGSVNSYVRWAYTGGALSGSQSFPAAGIAPGSYEARLYDYSNNLQAKSETFAITGQTLTPDKTSYLSTENAIFSFTGAAGSGTDWIAIIPQGSADSAYVRWAYTTQQSEGSVSISLANLSNGNYTAKLFANNTFTHQATSPVFSITGGAKTVSADKATYLGSETAHIAFTSVPPTPFDWVAVAPVGAPSGTYVRWQYTGGVGGGQLDFQLSGLSSGNYEARLFANNTLDLQATSTPFSISAFSVSTDKASYVRTETAQISFLTSPASAVDWISITAVGAPETAYSKWAYTGGASSGTLSFTLSDLPAGTYVARLYANNTFDLRATSTAFTVGGLTVSTSKATYPQTESVSVIFGGLPGNSQDWIAITTPGAAAGSFVLWAYTNGVKDGTHAFSNLPAGTYVARLHVNNGNAIAAESDPFTVTPAMAFVTEPQLPDGFVNQSYVKQLVLAGGQAPYGWGLRPGSMMPIGLSLGFDGKITGTPTVAGQYSIAVYVVDRNHLTADRTFFINIQP